MPGFLGRFDKLRLPLPETHMIQTPVVASSSLLMEFSQAAKVLTNSTPLELISWEPEGGREPASETGRAAKAFSWSSGFKSLGLNSGWMGDIWGSGLYLASKKTQYI